MKRASTSHQQYASRRNVENVFQSIMNWKIEFAEYLLLFNVTHKNNFERVLVSSTNSYFINVHALLYRCVVWHYVCCMYCANANSNAWQHIKSNYTIQSKCVFGAASVDRCRGNWRATYVKLQCSCCWYFFMAQGIDFMHWIIIDDSYTQCVTKR